MLINRHLLFFGAALIMTLAFPGLVLAHECNLDQDCGDAKTCTEDRCESGECVHEAILGCEEEAVAEEVEPVVTEEAPIEDENACEIDENCEEGMKCLENDCVEEHVECKLNEGCLEGEVCILGYCLFEEEEEDKDGCVFNEDCEDGQICQERHCVNSDEPIPTLYETDSEDAVGESESTIGTTSSGTITNQEALLGFIPIKQTVKLEINEDTNEIMGVTLPWWAFLSTNVSASEAIDVIVDEASEILSQALNSSTGCEEITGEQVNNYSKTLDRVRYFQGQLLVEDDLQSQLAWTQQKLQLRTLRGISQNCPNEWQAEIGTAQTTTTDLIPDKYKKVETKRAKLFRLIGMNMRVEIEVNAETGEEQIKHMPWWSWLAKIMN
ncbi:MAG: hypothetical protein ABIG32_01300 [Candidatus Uhrbacteria bacterium]|nr:hypothetical protein [Patescibacteria group bacterium]MBU1907142.1 hypothetical protein [Patescibacteria group bacterium]